MLKCQINPVSDLMSSSTASNIPEMTFSLKATQKGVGGKIAKRVIANGTKVEERRIT